MLGSMPHVLSTMQCVSLTIDYAIKDLVRFKQGDVRFGRVTPLKVRSCGGPVDMLYCELFTENFSAVANVPSFGSTFVSQGHTNLSAFKFVLINKKWLVTTYCKALRASLFFGRLIT